MRLGLIASATAALLLLAASEAPAAFGSGPDGLDRLSVRAEASGFGYERTAFGPAWSDVDHNGCDQRNDVLARDLTKIVKRNRCVVVAGTLVDPYTGVTVQFIKVRASAVQIDHVVSLAEAWRSGARSWTAAQRLAYANDPANLLATKGSVNQAKSDKDATRWVPIGSARRCRYARTVIAVKTKYRLSVDRAEKVALRRDLAGC